MTFLSENAYNSQRRLDAKFYPSTDWMQLPLDVEEEIVTCPPFMYKNLEVAPFSATSDQSIGLKSFFHQLGIIFTLRYPILHPHLPCIKVCTKFHVGLTEQWYAVIKISLDGAGRLILNKLTHLLMTFYHYSCIQRTSNSSLPCPSLFL